MLPHVDRHVLLLVLSQDEYERQQTGASKIDAYQNVVTAFH